MTETTTTTMTDPALLPQWKGHPVPWVARWSGEVLREPCQVGKLPSGKAVVFYEDGREFRDDRNVLWLREDFRRGGTPEFAQVSVHRQRTAMRKRLCQICGHKIPPGVIDWLMVPHQLEQAESGTKTVTMSPPTCQQCIPLALKLCPALKKAHIIVRVLEYRVWGVSGLLVSFDENGRTRQSDRQKLIPYDRPGWDYSPVLAKQQVVEFTKFVVT